MLNIIRQIAVLLAVGLTIALNILANTLPLNGLSTGEISDRFQVYFVPAGYVFSIWGLIYLALIGFAVYRCLPRNRKSDILLGIDLVFFVSCLANVSWLFLWHYEKFPWTLLAMLLLLISLILIYLKLGTGLANASSSEKWLVHYPFSLYLGWVSVATIANVSTVLVYLDWSGWGVDPAAWAVIMLGVVVILAGRMSFSRGDIVYSLVLVWAGAGIAVKQADDALVGRSAWLAVALISIMVAGRLLFGRSRQPT